MEDRFKYYVLSALASILYCLVFRDNEVFLRQGEEARREFLDELRDEAALYRMRGDSWRAER